MYVISLKMHYPLCRFELYLIKPIYLLQERLLMCFRVEAKRNPCEQKIYIQ